MIRYALACDAGHDFESWFPSSASYETQSERGLVSCPLCGSAKVLKRLMAPSVARTDKGAGAIELPRPTASRPMEGEPALPSPVALPVPRPTEPLALMAEPERQLRAMMRAVREQVMRSADHVGPRFAEEARRMHYGEAEGRSIYGEASPDETRALLDEGIEIMPLPPGPDDRN